MAALKATELRQAIDLMQKNEWEAAHKIVQEDEDSPLACWAHGIVHIMEGDLPNARYWYAQAKRTFPSKPTAAGEIRTLKTELST